MKRWLALFLIAATLFALGLAFVLPTGRVSLPNAACVAWLNAALALLALIGIAIVLTVACRRFYRSDKTT